MSDQNECPRTLGDDGLLGLPEIDRCGGPWGSAVPVALASILSSLPALDPFEAEPRLAASLDEYGDAPEPWWGLAVTMVLQCDLANASTCYENFRDRVDLEAALALHASQTEPLAARNRLRRLIPSLLRCRDLALAVRGLIMASGLELLFGDMEQTASLLRAALPRLRSLRPRSWGLAAEWMATVAIAAADQVEGRRPERILRFALRLARREPENAERIAAIGRDLGLLLNRIDRIADAEQEYADAITWAEAGASASLRTSIAIAQAENLRVQRRYVEAVACLDTALAEDLPDRLRASALLASADIMARLGSAHRDRVQLGAAKAAAMEAAMLLERAGLDSSSALRQRGLAEALLGDIAAALGTFFTLLRAPVAHRVAPSQRAELAYLAYWIRMAGGWPRKALFLAEYNLRLSRRIHADRPRDLILLHEHCIAAAERLGDLAAVRRHAIAMLGTEAAMLRTAFGDRRGPADWNRLRVAREGLSVLASMEAQSDAPGAAWRRAEALLAGRGLARAARRSSRRGATGGPLSSVREFIARHEAGDVLLALVSQHSPAPADPHFAWASGFSPPRLVALRVTGTDADPDIADLGDFARCATAVRRWTRGLAIGRDVNTPEPFAPIERWLRGASNVYVLAEGALELVPVGLLAPTAVVRQIAGIRDRRDHGSSSAPLLIVAADMLEEQFASATEREIALVRSALPDVRLEVASSVTDMLDPFAGVPRQIHIIAHGAAVLDPRATELDVYRGAGIALGSCTVTASQIADLHLEGVGCVILSSCDTALGAAQHAEGLASMAAAFLDAGAGAVIATLWPIPHEQTALFMALLYAQDLADPASALALARRCAEAQGLAKACWAAWVVHEAGQAG